MCVHVQEHLHVYMCRNTSFKHTHAGGVQMYMNNYVHSHVQKHLKDTIHVQEYFLHKYMTLCLCNIRTWIHVHVHIEEYLMLAHIHVHVASVYAYLQYEWLLAGIQKGAQKGVCRCVLHKKVCIYSITHIRWLAFLFRHSVDKLFPKDGLCKWLCSRYRPPAYLITCRWDEKLFIELEWPYRSALYTSAMSRVSCCCRPGTPLVTPPVCRCCIVPCHCSTVSHTRALVYWRKPHK